MRDIPPARRPPERVQRVNVEEIRRERALVRQENGSAFKRGRPGAVMPVMKRNEPQTTIREQHPALPAPKQPGRQPMPRGEHPRPAKGPEVIKGSPIPPEQQVQPSAHPAQPERKVAPQERGPATPRQQAPPARGESPRLTPHPERGAPREPRWQEPLPAKPGTQRQPSPTEQPGRPNTQRQSPPVAAPPVPPGGSHQQAPAAAPEEKGREHREAPAKPRPQQPERTEQPGR
jgi:hypothetical protein